MQVGTRELKNRLSYYLRLVKATGEPVFVTDRGAVVAELRPASPMRNVDEETVTALEAAGILTRGSGKLDDFVPARRRGRGKLPSRTLLDDRR